MGPGGERGMRACDIERCRVRAIALMRQLSKVRCEVEIGVLTICDHVETDAQRERDSQNQGSQSAEKGYMQRNLANGSVTTLACFGEGVPGIKLTSKSVDKNAPSGAFHQGAVCMSDKSINRESSDQTICVELLSIMLETDAVFGA